MKKRKDHQIRSRRRAAGTYQDRYLAFIDILGFASFVERSRKDPKLVSQIYDALSGISRRAANARSTELGLEAASFSDTTVLSLPATSTGLFHLFEVIDGFSIDLLSRNMLFRGAIVRGSVLHTSDVMFGPASIEAYRLETGISFHPRVMLDKQVYDDARNATGVVAKAAFAKYVVADSHDVSYLNPFAQWRDGSVARGHLAQLAQLQIIIATGLIDNAKQPAIGEKYKWLARKLNNFVASANLGEKIALIDLG